MVNQKLSHRRSITFVVDITVDEETMSPSTCSRCRLSLFHFTLGLCDPFIQDIDEHAQCARHQGITLFAYPGLTRIDGKLEVDDFTLLALAFASPICHGERVDSLGNVNEAGLVDRDISV